MIKIKLSVYVDSRNDKYVRIDYANDIKKERKSTLVEVKIDNRFSTLEEKIKMHIFSIDLLKMISLNDEVNIKIDMTDEVKALFTLYKIFVGGNENE